MRPPSRWCAREVICGHFCAGPSALVQQLLSAWCARLSCVRAGARWPSLEMSLIMRCRDPTRGHQFDRPTGT